MTVRVVSLTWGDAWQRYGEKFAKSFARYWPGSVELAIVTDRNLPLLRGRQIDLLCIPGYQAFIDRWKGDKRATGFDPPAGTRKVDANGYSWRHDAVKWMPQGIAPSAAMEGLADGDILVWFDSDVETTSAVPEGWIESLLGAAEVACIQRPGVHSEIGFYAMRMSPRTRFVLRLFADFYINDAVFRLSEWHSAYIWDRALETDAGLKVRNLNVTGVRGHAWPFIPELAAKTLHHKGKRKDA